MRSDTPQMTALLAAVASLIVAAIVAVGLDRNGVSDGLVIVAILIVPLIVYLTVSGAVTEIGGPGGLSAKFRAVASAPVDTSADIDDLQFIGKGAVQDLRGRARTLAPGKPVALTFRPGIFYDRMAIEEYLEHLLKIDRDLTIVFLDREGRLLASADGPSVYSVINNDHYGAEFQQAADTGDIAALRNLIPVTTTAIARNETNGSALRKMLDDRVRSMVAVDEGRRPVGVVRRDDVIARMMAKLTA
jgi:hypothetical protein